MKLHKLVLAGSLLISTAGYSKCSDLSNTNIDLVKYFEGFNSKAYWDAGHWAVGYGTRGLGITQTTVWGQERATKWLKIELQDTRLRVCKLLKTDLTDSQISALTSFTYNVGIGRLIRSGVLKDVNNRLFHKASKAILQYTRSRGVVLKGLVIRRGVEASLLNP